MRPPYVLYGLFYAFTVLGVISMSSVDWVEAFGIPSGRVVESMKYFCWSAALLCLGTALLLEEQDK